MTSSSEAARLPAHWLVAARIAWGAMAVAYLAILALALVALVRGFSAGGGAESSPLLALNRLLSWSVSLVCFALGIFIFWRKPNELITLLVSAFLLLYDALLNGRSSEALRALGIVQGQRFESGIQTLLMVGIFVPLLGLFPDGRIAPRWMCWNIAALIPWAAITILVPPFNEFGGRSLVGTVWPMSIVAPSVFAQIYRYARVSNVTDRQQTKWVVLGISAWFVWILLVLTPLGLMGPNRGDLLDAIDSIGWSAGLLLVPLSISIAVLRYRLWDIDLIIRRTLIYGALTALLAFVYFSGVVLLQQLFRAFTGQSSELAIIVSTLAIAALFAPLRRRVQDTIDRAFYRRKYDAQKVLAEFAATARDEVELEKLTARLVEVVQETMQPASVSLWLRKGK